MICPDCNKDVVGYTALGITTPIEHGCPVRKHPWQERAEKAEARVAELVADVERHRERERRLESERDHARQASTIDRVRVAELEAALTERMVASYGIHSLETGKMVDVVTCEACGARLEGQGRLRRILRHEPGCLLYRPGDSVSAASTDQQVDSERKLYSCSGCGRVGTATGDIQHETTCNPRGRWYAVAGVAAPRPSDAPAGRRFPVLYQNKEAERLRDAGEAPRTVPWSLLAPHEKQAKKNHDQTLERLAQRGGLSFCEMVAIIEGVSWRETFKLPIPEALDRLKKHMAAHEPIAALRSNDVRGDDEDWERKCRIAWCERDDARREAKALRTKLNEQRVDKAMAEGRWRVGTKLGRTLYFDDKCVGIVDNTYLACELVAAVNARAARTDYPTSDELLDALRRVKKWADDYADHFPGDFEWQELDAILSDFDLRRDACTAKADGK